MSFNPKYTITDKTLNNLTTITSAREVIERAYLVPKWEAKLRRQALLHNTHSSTAIEGNKLSLEQVEALSEGKDIIATNKDKQEGLFKISAQAVHKELTKLIEIKVIKSVGEGRALHYVLV